MAGHFLIVEARFYEEIVDAQVAGAIAALEAMLARHQVES